MLKTKLPSKLTFLYLSLLLLHTHLSICNGVSALSLNSLKTSDIGAMLKRVCTKKASQCIEPEMETETKRRVLVVQKRYISYDTLKKDLVPCERPGASYYNCHAGGVANPYTRGCEVITGCARDVRDIKS